MYQNHLVSPLNEDTETEIAKLQADFRGYYSVCLPKKNVPDMTSDDVGELFSQAGDVQDIYCTERYASLDEAAKSLGMFRDRFHVCAGTVRNSDRKPIRDIKEKSKPPKNKDHKNTRRAGDNKREKPYCNGTAESLETDHRNEGRNSKNHFKNIQSKKPGSGGKKDDRRNVSVNGQASNKERNKSKKDGPIESAGNGVTQSSNFELFAFNIESKEIFEMMIEDYEIESVKYFEKKNKKYAFLSMETREEAEKLMKELEGQIQNERELHIKYNTRYTNMDDDMSIKSDDLPSVGCNDVIPTLESVQEDEMPSLEVDYSDMPSLVKDSDFPDPDGRYNIDCRVYVTHFPFQCLESQLRAAFSKYRVSDICMVNNGEAAGCSRALLYMATIYDAIKVLKEMNNSPFFGRPIQVFAPQENVLLNHILMREKRRKL